MYGGIKAIAFDIDGTLYPSWRLYVSIAGYFLSNLRFFLKYNKVRRVLHKTAPLPDFFEYQARLWVEEMKHEKTLGVGDVEYAKVRINEVVYEGLKPYFSKIKTFPDVYQSFVAFKSSGLKVGILSDFPPEQKGDVWGIKDLCDVVLGTEETGALKPSAQPFKKMAELLNVPESEILYVGNSHKYDVVGSKNAGMKAAWLVQPEKGILGVKSKIADITFWKYSQLRQILLGNKETKK